MPFPVVEELLEFVGEACNAFDAGINGLQVFLQHNFVGVVGKGEVAEVAHVGGGPVGLAFVVEADAQKERSKALFGTGEVITGIRAGAADIAHGFVQGGRDAHGGDVAVAEGFGDEFGVAFVGLDLFAGFAFGFGWRHDDAFDAQLDELAGEHEAGRSRFVADFELLDFDAELLG
ncbi:hypothetical protein Rhal01_03689 [Rubritalea halochordaticola]|uniref:Uncharacterized protein n=1 Tax=Rubritalea halochordaticola TaxID=714537 RepID=A0ABP9V496_9BACT